MQAATGVARRCSQGHGRAEVARQASGTLNRKASLMKTLKLVALLGLATGAAAMNTGCVTPAYNAQERNAQIARNWDYEGKQITDDIDHALLLRPASKLTIWHVR